MNNYKISKYTNSLPLTIISGSGDFENPMDYGYGELLDDLSKSEVVRIISYSIVSDREKGLIELLEKNLREHPNHDIKIILGLPSRYGFERGTVDKYMNDVNATLGNLKEFVKLGGRVSFNLKSHAKLVGTKNSLYIGSQNFTSWSRSNFELGVILNDVSLIKEIYKNHFESCWNDDLVFKIKFPYSILQNIILTHSLLNDLEQSLSIDGSCPLTWEENFEILSDIVSILNIIGESIPNDCFKFKELLNKFNDGYKNEEKNFDFDIQYNRYYEPNPFGVEGIYCSESIADIEAKKEAEEHINDSIYNFTFRKSNIRELLKVIDYDVDNNDINNKEITERL
ncbi:phospholipase D-like domain-containing protein [Streptococcus suis]